MQFKVQCHIYKMNVHVDQIFPDWIRMCRCPIRSIVYLFPYTAHIFLRDIFYASHWYFFSATEQGLRNIMISCWYLTSAVGGGLHGWKLRMILVGTNFSWRFLFTLQISQISALLLIYFSDENSPLSFPPNGVFYHFHHLKQFICFNRTIFPLAKIGVNKWGLWEKTKR